MTLTDEEMQSLRDFKKYTDSDNIRLKEIVKNRLLANKRILYVLNNKELQDADAPADDYFNTNIYPLYMIPDVQTNVQNYICYESSFDEVAKYNQTLKYGQVIFYILCEQKTAYDETTGICRHDLLAALIMDEFNWCNMGMQYHCVSDKPSVVDTRYSCRTLIFQASTPNSLVKTKDSKTYTINNTGRI